MTAMSSMYAQWGVTINEWADHWAAGVWRACWQGSAAILLVWGLCWVLPQMPPRVRCWLWRLAYVKLLMALLWTSPIEIPLLRSPRTPKPLSAPILASAVSPTSRLPRIRLTGTGSPTYAVVTKPSLTPLSALMVIWLSGCLAVGAQFAREWRSARLRGRAAPLDSVRYAALAADFETLCQRLGVRRPIALLVTRASDRPHVLGVIHPAIVLPADLLIEAELASERTGLRVILAHEVAHVQRRDLL